MVPLKDGCQDVSALICDVNGITNDALVLLEYRRREAFSAIMADMFFQY
jgi:hypothetical protein